ncbi:hypothetical protein ACFY1U_02690 [Streptomyces sp. NPDC001351]
MSEPKYAEARRPAQETFDASLSGRGTGVVTALQAPATEIQDGD